MLEEMLRVHGGDASEGKSLPDVQDLIDARMSLVVDVDPPRDGLLAAADVEAPGRPVGIHVGGVCLSVVKD